MNREKIQAWLTKHALVSGIGLVDGEVRHDINSELLSYGKCNTAHGNDWHRTPELALSRAEEMRQAKIKSLRAACHIGKQISD